MPFGSSGGIRCVGAAGWLVCTRQRDQPPPALGPGHLSVVVLKAQLLTYLLIHRALCLPKRYESQNTFPGAVWWVGVERTVSQDTVQSCFLSPLAPMLTAHSPSHSQEGLPAGPATARGVPTASSSRECCGPPPGDCFSWKWLPPRFLLPCSSAVLRGW